MVKWILNGFCLHQIREMFASRNKKKEKGYVVPFHSLRTDWTSFTCCHTIASTPKRRQEQQSSMSSVLKKKSHSISRHACKVNSTDGTIPPDLTVASRIEILIDRISGTPSLCCPRGRPDESSTILKYSGNGMHASRSIRSVGFFLSPLISQGDSRCKFPRQRYTLRQ